MAHERNCIVCGRQYRYCPKCREFEYLEKWHTNYCNEQCKNVSSIINRYAFKHINKSEAKKLLEENNITKENNILPKYKVYIDEILTPAPKGRKKKKVIVNED
jgi:hypothetical protein